jgi:outer membrane protein assembly factor BamB
MTLGSDVEISKEQPDIDRFLYPEYYDCYSVDEIDGYVEYQDTEVSIEYEPVESTNPIVGPPMDSPWPMYCHDVRHTGRSPYSTTNNMGEEKWRLRLQGLVWGSPIIDGNGIIYVGAWDFYAIYPNGTIKWQMDISAFSSAAAIGENGIIYVGTIWASPNYLYAIYSNNGTLKWKFKTDNHIFSSPAIGEDGVIYFGSEDENIYALYPNGTLKWKYKTGHAVLSSPAIGNDGTVYCGSHDTYLYAFHPNNGTLRWKYKTGDWIRTSPSIAYDGTIYIVSLDNFLHAVYPDGTGMWKTNVGAGPSPTIGQDGTIYCGYSKLYAVNPTNGSIKWTFDVLGKIRGATPCNSIDGTIYLGNYDGSDIVAVNPDGTEKWRVSIGGDVESAPAIGEDGTVYIGDGRDDGYLHAFGWCELEADANGPYYGRINESIQFQGSAKGGYRPHSYHWNFGDGNNSYEEDPTHIYSEPGNYTVVFTVTDNTSNTSSDTSWALIQETNYPPDKPDIDGPVRWPVKVEVCFTFHSTDPDGDDVKYLIDWGDDNINETEYYPSCTPIEVCHTWEDMDKYTLQAKSIDIWGAESDWNVFVTTIPRNRMVSNLWYQWFLERFPLLEKLLSLLKVM